MVERAPARDVACSESASRNKSRPNWVFEPCDSHRAPPNTPAYVSKLALGRRSFAGSAGSPSPAACPKRLLQKSAVEETASR